MSLGVEVGRVVRISLSLSLVGVFRIGFSSQALRAADLTPLLYSEKPLTGSSRRASVAEAQMLEEMTLTFAGNLLGIGCARRLGSSSPKYALAES